MGRKLILTCPFHENANFFAIFVIMEIQKIDLEALFFRILKLPKVKI